MGEHDRPPQWGEPGYVPPPIPPPTREKLQATRRRNGRLCVAFSVPAAVVLGYVAVAYGLLKPGEDDFGVGMLGVYGLLLLALPAATFGVLWWDARAALRRRDR